MMLKEMRNKLIEN